MNTVAVLLLCFVLGVSSSPISPKTELEGTVEGQRFVFDPTPFESCLEKHNVTKGPDANNNCGLQCLFLASELLVENEEINGQVRINKEKIYVQRPELSFAIDNIIDACKDQPAGDEDTCEYSGCLYRNGISSIFLKL